MAADPDAMRHGPTTAPDLARHHWETQQDDVAWTHTRAEWEQAWNQARHLESMSGQWLGFFFTAVLGVTAIVGPKLTANDSRSLLLIAVLSVTTLESLAAVLLLAVVRLSRVHCYYDQIIFAISQETNTSPPAAVDLTAFRFPPQPARQGRAGALATTKGASQAVLAFGAATFASVLVGDSIRAFTVPWASTPTRVVCSLGLLVGLAIPTLVGWLLRPGAPPAPSANP